MPEEKTSCSAENQDPTLGQKPVAEPRPQFDGGSDILSDLFGYDFSGRSPDSGFQGPNPPPVGRPSSTPPSSVGVMEDKFHIPNSYLLVPVFLLIGLITYYGNYVHPQASPHKSIFAVNSIQSYFATTFWRTHGVFLGALLLLGTIFLPRTTMWWFAIGNPIGWVGSLGWCLAPRTTLAFLTTVIYWHTNPELCGFMWLAAYGVASVKIDWAREQLSEDDETIIRDIFRVLAILIGIGAFIVAGFLALLLLSKLFVALVAGISNTNAIMASMVAVLIFGSLLYVFRTVSKLWYGITEIVLAVLLAGYTMARTVKSSDETIASIDLFTTLLALSSSTYIVVRGLDNVGERNFKKLYIKLKRLISRPNT